VSSDVPQRCRTEKRIDDGVRDRVTVGMTTQAGMVRNRDTAQDKETIRVETVGIVSDADSHDSSSRP
jgi:hypothetical protein